MPNSFTEFVGLMGGAVVIVLVVLVLVLWILLPFAIFGLKPLLRKLAASSATRDEALLAEFRKITLALHKLHKEAQRSDLAASGPAKDTEVRPQERIEKYAEKRAEGRTRRRVKNEGPPSTNEMEG